MKSGTVFARSVKKLKKPLKHVKKVKHVRWLLPGWVFYEFYKLHKQKGHTRARSFEHGAKAEAIRLVAMATLPIPGTYELTTGGLALLKKKIERDEVKKLTLKAFKDFTPLNKLKIDKSKLRGEPYLRIFYKDRHVYFKVFYKKK